MKILQKIVTVSLSGLVALAMNAAALTSDIKGDENLIFFNTDAYKDAATGEWIVPVHGWVFELESAWLRKRAFAAAINTTYGYALNEATADIFERRTGLLIADNERNKRVVVRFGDMSFALPPSAPNGHFYQELRWSEAQMAQLIKNIETVNQPGAGASLAKPNRLRFSAVLNHGDTRSFDGEVRLVPAAGISVISDIDDTIKITQVTSTADMINATFYQPFAAVPDINTVYQHWSQQGKAVHFISSSPWQLYPELEGFARDEGFPWASYYLKQVRFRDTTFFNLFKSSTTTKPGQIETLLTRYPNREFILVGDSGEHDPEIYAHIRQQYPKRIRKIFIRNVTQASLNDTRFASLTQQLPDNCMQLFADALALYDPGTACLAE